MKKNPGVNITVSESGSGNGAKGLINAACDVANMSRPMKSSEKKAAQDAGIMAVETVIAAKNGSRKELATEIADLFYHLLVLTAERDIPLREILAELNARAGIGQSH